MNGSTSPGPLRPIRSHVTTPLGLMIACVLLAPALATAVSNRFAISATASLHPAAASTQSAGGYQLKATLSAMSAKPQSGLGYSLAARITAQPLVCASDTIFEDGFDGP